MKWKLWSWIFLAMTLVLSHIMCADAAYRYCSMIWCAKVQGCSAPASVAFLVCIPYGAGILICGLVAWFFWKKAKNSAA